MMSQPADNHARPEFLERHYTVAELSKSWHMSTTTLRLWFAKEPGVLRAGTKKSSAGRKYVLMRVPESVARRVYQEKINRRTKEG
jgi:hypothetical protein